MKKILCLLLALMLLLTCFAGCKKKPDDTSSTISSGDVSDTQGEQEFVKPENYASVVTVTINPQFRLYLDANGTVLAVEPVNADAKTIEAKINFENKKVEDVVSTLIVVANDSGFVKEDAKIDIKVTEVVDQTVVATDILSNIKVSANDKLAELKITAEVSTSVELKTEEPTESDASSTPQDTSNSKPAGPTPAPACKHTSTKVQSASTGSNIIDSSKLDAVNHTIVCNDCGKQIGVEKHAVANGKCTACGQSNLATTSVELRNAGISGGASGHCGAEISSDGLPDFDYMMQEGYFAIGYETLQQYLDDSGDNWYYRIPESVYLTALKTRFVVDDSLFTKLKAQGEYEFFWCNHSYSNGMFNIPYMAAGDVSAFTHDVIGYKDNGKGTITIYYDYLEGGPDVEVADRKHQFYYAMEYTYSGASNLEVSRVDEEYYSYYTISGWTPVVNSLRIKSIKKVTDISGLTKLS